MDATTVGVDLAKNVFVACVADCAGRIVARREFNRAGFLTWLGTLPTGTVIGMEACGSAHHWGRTAQRLGLAPRLMAAEFVRPYRKRQSVKNDRADAEAILVALLSPGMRFIPVKTEAQQQRLAWHSLRVGWVEERTALLNRVRGLLAEFGLIVDPGPKHLRALLAEREFDTALSPALRGLIQSVRDQLDALDTRIGECDRQITAQQANDPLAKRARDLPGVGLITADAVTASVGDASMFKQRASVCRVARPHAQPVGQRRQDEAWAHHAARRRLLANPACAGRAQRTGRDAPKTAAGIALKS
jgi:transposase